MPAPSHRSHPGRAEARIWHDPVLQLKVAHLRQRARTGDTGGIVFAGSSQVLEGVLPSVAAPGLGRRAYNAGLHRGFLPLTEPWLLEVVLPLARPRLVVLGVSVLDLNDNGIAQREVLERFQASPARRHDVVARVQRTALGRRFLCRRLPRVRLDDLRIGPDGEGLEFADAVEYRLSDTKRRYIEDELLVDYRTGPRTVDALERIVSGVRARGADIVVVEMPVTEELDGMLPRGAADHADARTVLRDATERLGVRLLDVAADVTDHRWFADCVHHSGAGMRHVSALVAGALADDLARVA